MSQILAQPRFRGVMHHVMFFVSIVACIPLILKSTNYTEATSMIIYSVGLLSMFGFSALYHRRKSTIEVKKFLRKLDHTGIFLMIAGTFTPVCLLALPADSGLTLLTIIWIVAFIGILQSIFFGNSGIELDFRSNVTVVVLGSFIFMHNIYLESKFKCL